MMWCYCYHLHSNLNFARIQSKKIISITPFVNMSFQQLNSLSSWNCHKDNERYFILQLKVAVKIRVENYFYFIFL